MLLQVMPRLVDPVAASALNATFRDLTLLDFAATALENENNKERSPVTDRIGNALRGLKDQIIAFRVEQNDSDQAPPQTVTLGVIRMSLRTVRETL